MTSRLLLLLGLLLPLGAVAQEPQNLDAVPGNQENTLTWDAPTVDDDKTVVCYGVYRDTEAIGSNDPEDQSEKRIEGVEAAEGTAPAYTDRDLSASETYY